MSAPSIPQAENSGFVARHAHVWLGLMLLSLHAATAWGVGTVWASALLLMHFGLFLMWQPLWQGDGELRPSQAFLVILIGILLATFSNWWLIAVWLATLTALIGGSVPGITRGRQRDGSRPAVRADLAPGRHRPPRRCARGRRCRARVLSRSLVTVVQAPAR